MPGQRKKPLIPKKVKNTGKGKHKDSTVKKSRKASEATMRQTTRSRSSSRQHSRPTSSKSRPQSSRTRSKSPAKKPRGNKEADFLFETGTLGSGMQSLSLAGSCRDTNHAPQYSMRGVAPEAFVRMVRETFRKKPDVYKKFVSIVSQVGRQDVNKLDLVKKVITLFDGYPRLIEGFNTFLPAEYSIEIQNDAVVIKVYEAHGVRSSVVDSYTPMPEMDEYTTEATVSYVQRVKEMYADKPHKYRNFTEILRDYHSKNVDEVKTIHRIVTLFKSYPHLVDGFNTFLPPGYHVYMYADNSGYDIEYPGHNEGERTITQYN